MTSPSSDGSRARGKAADSRFGPKLRGFSECLRVQRQVVQHLSQSVPTVQALRALRFGLLGRDIWMSLRPSSPVLIGNLGEPSVYNARPLGSLLAKLSRPAAYRLILLFLRVTNPSDQHPYRGRPSFELLGTTNSFRASSAPRASRTRRTVIRNPRMRAARSSSRARSGFGRTSA
jgi:hypothetical protein